MAAKEREPDEPPEPPWEVEITIMGGRRPPDHGDRGRSGARPRARSLALLAVAAAAAVAALAFTVPGGDHRATRSAAVGSGRTVVEAADVSPFRCLSVKFAQGDPSYARAQSSDARPCRRFYRNLIAIFHRVRGRWRQVLETTYGCPMAAIPPAVLAELAVCRHAVRPAQRHPSAVAATVTCSVAATAPVAGRPRSRSARRTARRLLWRGC